MCIYSSVECILYEWQCCMGNAGKQLFLCSQGTLHRYLIGHAGWWQSSDPHSCLFWQDQCCSLLSAQSGQLLPNWVIYQCSCITKTVPMQEAQWLAISPRKVQTQWIANDSLIMVLRFQLICKINVLQMLGLPSSAKSTIKHWSTSWNPL